MKTTKYVILKGEIKRRYNSDEVMKMEIEEIPGAIEKKALDSIYKRQL